MQQSCQYVATFLRVVAQKATKCFWLFRLKEVKINAFALKMSGGVVHCKAP